jgi:predicted TIM-barrel fold metal-dependent hydrolase
VTAAAVDVPPIVSADSHVLEPHDLWTTRLAGGRFADRAPHMVEHEEHGHLFVIDGLRPFPIGLAGAAGRSSDELRATGDRAEDLRAGGWDATARLDDMDADGVAAEVLYPSVGMTLAQSADREYQVACIRAYNDWLADFVAAGKGRLVGLAMIPTLDADAAVAEIERAVSLGLRGAMVPGLPPEGHYAEERFDPMWAAFAERRLPVSFHILTGAAGGDPTLGSGLGMLGVMSVVHQVQQTLALLVFGRVFDRHPHLQVVSAEHDGGWVAHFAHRLDQMWERHHNWLGRRSRGLEHEPSLYLRRNVSYTFQKDPVAVETRHRVGVDRLLWASDYPHSDSTWPHSRKVIERDFVGVPADEVQAIVHDNACALYGLSST